MFGYVRAIVVGVGAALLILLIIKINGWRNDSAKLDDLYAQIQLHNQQQEKSDAIGTKLEKDRVVYREVARKLDTDTPYTGCRFGADGVQRISARIEAGEAAR